MAIQKDILWKGCTISYWRIGSHRFDPNTLTVIFDVEGFKDHTARLSDVTAFVFSKTMTVPFTEAALLTKSPRQRGYAWIKANTELSGGIDIFETGQTA